jgi:transcriptional regulator with XRE-family HTH domain
LDREVQNRAKIEAADAQPDPAAMNVLDSVKNLGAQVRRVRKERCLTQRVLAGRMNVPRTYISKVEMGRVVPTLGTLWRIAGALEVTVIDLLSDEAERTRHDELGCILKDPFLTEIARMVEKLNVVQRALILRAVHDVASGYGHLQQDRKQEVTT